MAKILGISGSPRNKSTEYALGEALKSIESRDGIETSMIMLRGKKIAPCNGCGYCKKNKTWCCLKDDFEPLLKEFMEADAYLFGSPVYAYGPTPQLSAFFSRMRPLFHVYPELMRDKIGSAFAVGGTRNGGEEATITAMHNMIWREESILSVTRYTATPEVISGPRTRDRKALTQMKSAWEDF